MQHLNPSFNIQAGEIDFETAQLFAEAGPMGLSLTVLDHNNCFSAVVMYAFNPGLSEQEITEQLQSVCRNDHLLQRKYYQAHLYWNFAESIIVPAELMNAETQADMLDLVFGDAKQTVSRTDFLYKHNLHQVYRLPVSMANVFAATFPAATQSHSYAALINRKIPAGEHVFAIFYSNHITIMLCKDGKLQVVQQFNYRNADDCAFHLLNVCKGFMAQLESVTLHINGMIDEKSALYAAIYKYFLNIEFDSLPEGYDYADEIKEYPSHFFSHLFELASCV